MLSIILPNHKEAAINGFIEEVERILPASEIIISCDSESKGKGWTVREGIVHAKGDQIAVIDGDGDIPARMLLRMLPFLADFDAVVGSKRIGKSPLRRKIMTRLTRLWFKILYGVKVDTQTGIKLFRREALDALCWSWESNGFIYDAEVLARLQDKGFRLIEVPIECDIKRQVTFKTIFRIFMESIWLWFRLLFRQEK